ncbi:MAG TPA: DUF4325 domain-containing protein [Bacteroidia bacterium]|nr:DUF4325 domain-containing protein [Bacteroidia bacterium]HRH07369.1 DUF4325 domain-containing protein [Bacteroidia bacterium]
MKTEIIIRDVVTGTSTNDEAYPLFILMDGIIRKDNSIILSLKGCSNVSSSFLNSSIGSLYDKYGYSKLKGKIFITNSTPALAKLFKKYVENLKSLV